jgi:hypothetical protein
MRADVADSGQQHGREDLPPVPGPRSAGAILLDPIADERLVLRPELQQQARGARWWVPHAGVPFSSGIPFQSARERALSATDRAQPPQHATDTRRCGRSGAQLFCAVRFQSDVITRLRNGPRTSMPLHEVVERRQGSQVATDLARNGGRRHDAPV